jgi:hypothetical protein
MQGSMSPLYKAIRKNPEAMRKVNEALAREKVAYVRWNGKLYQIRG